VSWRRGFRAALVGVLMFIFAQIYVPQCKVQIYADNANAIGGVLAAVIAFLAYRFK